MASRSALVQSGLERLADRRGDITGRVLARYYRQCPQARASFRHHGREQTAELEGRMVAETIYLLLQWATDPAAARLEQANTIVHHNDALDIPPHWYLALIDAVLAEVLETPGEDPAAECKAWLSIRDEMAEFIEGLRGEFVRPGKGTPLPVFAGQGS